MPASLQSLIPAFQQFQLAYTAIRIGLPQRLADGPRDLVSLANELNIPATRLGRLLRGMVWAGWIKCPSPETFALTESGREFLDGPCHEGLSFHGQFFYHAWGHFADYIEHGRIPYEEAHGIRIFDQLSRDPALARDFNGGFARRTSEYSAQIAQLPTLKNAHRIIDVGGGDGRLLLDILIEQPNAHGVVFDLPMLEAAAESAIEASSVAARCRFEPGDMFRHAPSGADIYLLKWVLHDWEDAKAAQILQNVRRAMCPTSRLLIIERLMPDEMDKMLSLVRPDLNMLCLNGGGEPTREEYRMLLQTAGLDLLSVEPIESKYGFVALEAAIRSNTSSSH